MAMGDIHLETGTICKAKTAEACPYGGGHVDNLEQFASYYSADLPTLKGLVENAKMDPKAALDLMGSGEMVDTPPAITKAPYVDPVQRNEAAQQKLADLLGPVPERKSPETPQERYDRQMKDYKIAMVEYENQMLANYEAALEAHRASPFAPRPTPPPLRTVYPKSFEAYNQIPKDFLSDEIPAEIASQPDGEGLWEEYLRKRKQLGDVAHSRGDGPGQIHYL